MNKQLESIIEESARELKTATVRIPASVQAQALVGPVNFCQFWPIAKSVLEELEKLLPKFAWVIAILISIGDKACPQ